MQDIRQCRRRLRSRPRELEMATRATLESEQGEIARGWRVGPCTSRRTRREMLAGEQWLRGIDTAWALSSLLQLAQQGEAARRDTMLARPWAV